MPRISSTEESSSPLRTVVIILGLACLGLGWGLYKRHSSAVDEAEAATKALATSSNQVNELRTKLALDHSDAFIAQTNLQFALERRCAELLVTSNRLVQTSLLVSHAQNEARAAQSDLQTKAAAIATLEAQRDELSRRLEAIPALQKELAVVNEKLQLALFGHDELAEIIGRVRIEKADLERKLDDPDFLRLQRKKADDAAEVRKHIGAGRPVNASDKRLRLVLQPDGTVRTVAPAATQAGK
ncbi:MAG TPA: hypothetical protein VGK40_08025 [Verrucomicrobiae bacterium]|jgi:hypothetical protein